MKLNSVEYYSYKEYYNYNIHNGYVFRKEYIFRRSTNFVEYLYDIRKSYPKSDPMNYIAKLLMNSLFGRFALRVLKNKYEFINKSEFFSLASKDAKLKY
jgi:hypothetical protein